MAPPFSHSKSNKRFPALTLPMVTCKSVLVGDLIQRLLIHPYIDLLLWSIHPNSSVLSHHYFTNYSAKWSVLDDSFSLGFAYYFRDKNLFVAEINYTSRYLISFIRNTRLLSFHIYGWRYNHLYTILILILLLFTRICIVVWFSTYIGLP